MRSIRTITALALSLSLAAGASEETGTQAPEPTLSRTSGAISELPDPAPPATGGRTTVAAPVAFEPGAEKASAGSGGEGEVAEPGAGG